MKKKTFVLMMSLIMLLSGCGGETVHVEQFGYSGMVGEVEESSIGFDSLSIDDTDGGSLVAGVEISVTPNEDVDEGIEETADTGRVNNWTSSDRIYFNIVGDLRVEEVDDVQGVGYNVESRRYCEFDEVKEKYINIVYPEVVNMGDEGLQEKINKHLYDTAFDIFLGYETNGHPADIDVIYEVAWAGEIFLSVKFYVNFFGKGAAYCNHQLNTANIDIRTGEYVRMNDFFVLDSAFLDKFKTCAIMDMEKYYIFLEQLKYIFWDNDDEKVLKELNNTDIPMCCDEELIDFATQMGMPPQPETRAMGSASYFTGENLGICYKLAHVSGSYAEIVISYEDLMENIRMDNDIWYEIMPSLREGVG